MTREELITNVLEQVRQYSMVDDGGLRFSFNRVLNLVENEVPGVIVECGTWLGGCAFGMALAQKCAYGRVVRPVYLMDSFEGLPSPKEWDGPAAMNYAENRYDPQNYNNCCAPIESVKTALSSLNLSEIDCPIIKGWFSETVPDAAAKILGSAGIALLRIDCDWYDSVQIVLDHLAPHVVEGGTIILDDYYAWDGCARATHNWLSANDFPFRIRQGGEGLPWAWLERRSARSLDYPM